MKTLRRLMRRIWNKITGHEVVHIIGQMPVGFELSDGDRAALYGWPDKTIEEAENEFC